jgi:hypothetical protein
LDNVFQTIQNRYNLNPSDFPPLSEFQDKLRERDFSSFSHLNEEMIAQLDVVLDRDVPRLMESLPGVSSGVVDSGTAEGLINFMEDGIRVIKHGIIFD